MNYLIMTLFSVLSGMAIATQSGMSGQLGRLLNNPLMATFVIYVSSTVIISIILIVLKTPLPSFELIKAVPWYLWISGALLSVIALSCVYWLMPIIGVPKVMVGVLFGQLLISMVGGHFGWFNMPVTNFNIEKLIGTVFLFVGIVFINK